MFEDVDSVRYVQHEKDQPYALIWKRKVLNLWLAGRDLGGCQWPPNRSHYSCVYRGTVPDLFAIDDTIRLALVDTAAVNCTVPSGAGWLVASGDTALRGLVVTRRLGPCGSSDESLALFLDRVAN